MAIKMSDFLQVYLGCNPNIDDLEVWIYQPSTDANGNEESYKVKKSLRNYILFGDYYIEDITLDWYPHISNKDPFLSISITKEPLDSYQSCPFAYEH